MSSGLPRANGVGANSSVSPSPRAFATSALPIVVAAPGCRDQRDYPSQPPFDDRGLELPIDHFASLPNKGLCCLVRTARRWHPLAPRSRHPNVKAIVTIISSGRT
jgi:hypothetical protein